MTYGPVPVLCSTMTTSYILTQYVILSFVSVLCVHYNSQLETLRDETALKLGVQYPTFLPTIQNTSKQCLPLNKLMDSSISKALALLGLHTRHPKVTPSFIAPCCKQAIFFYQFLFFFFISMWKSCVRKQQSSKVGPEQFHGT